ncbi:MAG: ribosomal RNA large subunit methyltransferase E [Candidatus Micrarchaeota archaeon]|nr:MAG: ribosomal RNA large subunit methyltransferase E [Candidatus Micrarchaeota archaeon]
MFTIFIKAQRSALIADYINELYNKVATLLDNDIISIKDIPLTLCISIIEDPLINRHISKVILANEAVDSIEELVTVIKERVKNEYTRLEVVPSEAEDKLLLDMEANGIKLSPSRYDKVLYIFKGNKIYFSLLDKSYIFKKIQDRHISRAYYKMMEAVKRFKISLSKSYSVLDIGAAPGGWSEYLKDYVKEIVAVDPGDLLVNSYNIRHIKGRFEDVVDSLAEYCCFDLIVIDVNRDPIYAAELLIKASGLAKKDAKIIMTAKLFKRSKSYRDHIIERFRSVIKDRFLLLDMKRLISNSDNEITLLLSKI